MTSPTIHCPAHARVVVIGGGVSGVSAAWHLTRRGWRDVVLLERADLGSGATWLSAGILAQLDRCPSLVGLVHDSITLFGRLGRAASLRRVGSLAVATGRARLEQLQRAAQAASCIGVKTALLSREAASRLWPLMRADDLLGAVHVIDDALHDPLATLRLLAAEAREGGAQLIENLAATGFEVVDDHIVSVITPAGAIATDYVIDCAGVWSREVGIACGVSLPLAILERVDAITESLDGIDLDLPILQCDDGPAYIAALDGRVLLARGDLSEAASPVAGRPGFDREANDGRPGEATDLLALAARRVPLLAGATLRRLNVGLVDIAPDGGALLGPVAGRRNLLVAAGLGLTGSQAAGGIGRALAEWLVDGRTTRNLGMLDPRRLAPFQSNARYLRRGGRLRGYFRRIEAEPELGVDRLRGLRRSPLHDRLAARGAVFIEQVGWEVPAYFEAPLAASSLTQRFISDDTTASRNGDDETRAEHLAIREAVGIYDGASLAKILVAGPDAEATLEAICANRIGVAVGRAVHTPLLNRSGGIEGDALVMRVAADEFLLLGDPRALGRLLDWLRRHVPPRAAVVVTDMSAAYGVLEVVGPRSRALLARLTPDDLSADAFPQARVLSIDFAYVRLWACRFSPLGELGWFLVMPGEVTVAVFDALIEEGDGFGLRPVGLLARRSLCVEKGHRRWGTEMGASDTPYEAGLMQQVALDKPSFIGREALLARRGAPMERRLVHIALESGASLMQGHEPIWCEGEVVGCTTSGALGHSFGRPLGMGYITLPGGVTPPRLRAANFEVEVAPRRLRATVSLRPFYDPLGNRIRM